MATRIRSSLLSLRRHRHLIATLLCGLWLLGGRLVAAPQFARDSELIDRVIDLIERRLALMPEVAAIKFQQQRPIADPAREGEVLNQSVGEAQGLHLDPVAARAFFSVQIQMARAVQERLFERWRAGVARPPPGRDLVKELRPALDAIGRDLLPAVYLASCALVETPAPTLAGRLSRLRQYDGTTEEHVAELGRALGGMRITAPANWSTVQKVGALRVGTTGDYAPFSEERAGVLYGFDVERAEALGKSWGVSVLFVRTSWSSLMRDLAGFRFDLAASGVSITEERRRQADFSEAYYFDGKTPIARRENAERFSSLEQINQPDVRVIVNPGGTNERFAREHLPRATLLVHPDNRTVFEELVAGRADVMITDGIEVRLQERRHPELQGTRSEPFTRTGKALLLPAGSDLTARVNAWCHDERESGRVSERLARALDAAAH